MVIRSVGARSRVRGAAYAGVALSAALVLAACSGSEEPDAAGPSGSAASGSVTSSSASPSESGSASPSASSSPESESPGGPQPTRPATTAGSLVQASLPAPAALGPRWEYYVDGGDVEGNYVGNGTAAQSRDPDELVSALVPPGCAVESVYAVALPSPAYALEVGYAHPAGVSGIGIGLEFTSAAEASQFVRAYVGALAACTPSGGAPEGAVVVTALGVPEGAEALSRIEDPYEQTTWTELVVRRNAVVTLLGADAASGAALPRWPAVATAL